MKQTQIFCANPAVFSASLFSFVCEREGTRAILLCISLKNAILSHSNAIYVIDIPAFYHYNKIMSTYVLLNLFWKERNL